MAQSAPMNRTNDKGHVEAITTTPSDYVSHTHGVLYRRTYRLLTMMKANKKLRIIKYLLSLTNR